MKSAHVLYGFDSNRLPNNKKSAANTKHNNFAINTLNIYYRPRNQIQIDRIEIILQMNNNLPLSFEIIVKTILFVFHINFVLLLEPMCWLSYFWTVIEQQTDTERKSHYQMDWNTNSQSICAASSFNSNYCCFNRIPTKEPTNENKKKMERPQWYQMHNCSAIQF